MYLYTQLGIMCRIKPFKTRTSLFWVLAIPSPCALWKNRSVSYFDRFKRYLKLRGKYVRSANQWTVCQRAYRVNNWSYGLRDDVWGLFSLNEFLRWLQCLTTPLKSIKSGLVEYNQPLIFPISSSESVIKLVVLWWAIYACTSYANSIKASLSINVHISISP